jgi:hypothetical protein
MTNEMVSTARTQKFRIIAQDPSVRVNGRILTALVEVPAEQLAPGPWGHRVHVLDFDASTQTLYRPCEFGCSKGRLVEDRFARADDHKLLNDPGFHAQNVYAIVMRILARFEFALGRRVSWGFEGHQLKVAPHAFADANAFYSGRDEALMFGYFPGEGDKTVFTCLSHDVVAHETTHALVDGLRERYTDPSSPDQAGFHEGFSDVVALLSVFALPDVVRAVIDLKFRQADGSKQKARRSDDTYISLNALDPVAMRKSILFGLADQMGEELSKVRGQPLRRSAQLRPSPHWYRENDEFKEPHRRGEILVAAMMNAFLEVWSARLHALDPTRSGWLDRERVVEEGARAADRLLTMSIRALDYCPPVHIEFGDFLSALVTADFELQRNDISFEFRRYLLASFQAYGIKPTSKGNSAQAGLWLPPESEASGHEFNYSRNHFESMLRDPEEVFRFIWENRQALHLYDGAYTRVQSVRPCLRIAEDGFALRETVAEYLQILRLTAKEISGMGIRVEGLASGPAWVVALHHSDNRVHCGGVVQACKLCRVVACDVEGGRGIDGFQDRESAAFPLLQQSVLYCSFQGLLFHVGQLAEVGNVSFFQCTLNDRMILLTACHVERSSAG